jgi:hypothetical protein
MTVSATSSLDLGSGGNQQLGISCTYRFMIGCSSGHDGHARQSDGRRELLRLAA